MSEAVESFEDALINKLAEITLPGKAGSIDLDAPQNQIAATLVDLKLYTPQTIFRPDVLKELMEKTLGPPLFRDFMLGVLFRFMAGSGSGTGYLEALCVNLADGLIIDGPEPGLNTLPDVVTDSTPLAFFGAEKQESGFFTRFFNLMRGIRQTSVEDFLRSNPMLIFVLLLQFVDLSDNT